MRTDRSPFNRGAARYRMGKRSDDEAEIFIYDEIGLWGVNAKDFQRDLQTIKAETIHLRLNSPGGNVFDGVTIANLLKDHPARVVTHIDGLAASIASIIALAGDEVRMATNAFFMIHNPWTVTIGDAAQLRHDAGVLDKIGGQIVETYRARLGSKDDGQIRDWMDKETWFNAEEAESAGFVEAIDGKSEAQASFDLSVFLHAPAALVASDAQPTKRDVERLLRDAGLSRTEAKTFAASGFHALEERDAPVDVLRSAERLLATLTPAGA